MAQDCPYCGLTNPPSAVRCDCGYDFSRHQVEASYLTAEDQARIAVGPTPPRIPVVAPFPLGCLGVLFFHTSNVHGGALVFVCGLLAFVVGSILNGGGGVYFLTFGILAIVLDVVTRLAVLRCSLIDVRRGSQFFVFPVWVVGFVVGFLAAMYLLA